MTHREQVQRYIDDMKAKGVGPWTSAPPLFRLLWNLGVDVPPPYYLSFRAHAFMNGLPMAILWFAGMLWFMGGRPHVVVIIGLASIWVGVQFGRRMASWFRKRAAAFDLPPWSHYRETSGAPRTRG